MPASFHLRKADNGVAYLVCDGLEAPHAFSTRIGGLSEGPYAGLNLGVSSGDAAETVYANRTLWREALGLAAPPVSLHQVHGPVVHAVTGPLDQALKGDAVVSDVPELAVGVFTADCTPILLHDPVTGAVGAVHAGWRGTVAQVLVETVKELAERYGAQPGSLRAAIGPAIGPCCFEVGPEVAAAAAESAWPGWERAVVPRSPRPHFDLFAANADQLLACGLAPEHLFVSGLCTACHPELFFSWRRDGGETGRLQAVVARRKA